MILAETELGDGSQSSAEMPLIERHSRDPTVGKTDCSTYIVRFSSPACLPSHVPVHLLVRFPVRWIFEEDTLQISMSKMIVTVYPNSIQNIVDQIPIIQADMVQVAFIDLPSFIYVHCSFSSMMPCGCLTSYAVSESVSHST